MVLLDTCTLLWLVSNPSQLSAPAAAAIEEADDLLISPMSLFEIARKVGHGTLTFQLSPLEWYREAVKAHGMREIEINASIADGAATLPPIHKDPADRFLIATALEMGAAIVTPDPWFKNYPVQVIW